MVGSVVFSPRMVGSKVFSPSVAGWFQCILSSKIPDVAGWFRVFSPNAAGWFCLHRTWSRVDFKLQCQQGALTTALL